MKYNGNLRTKLLFLQNVENAFTTFLHSTDDLFNESSLFLDNLFVNCTNVLLFEKVYTHFENAKFKVKSWCEK